MITTFINEGAY